MGPPFSFVEPYMALHRAIDKAATKKGTRQVPKFDNLRIN